MNEIQSRLEIHRLKAELEDDRLKIQQLEYEVANLKIKQTTNDMKSINVNLVFISIQLNYLFYLLESP